MVMVFIRMVKIMDEQLQEIVDRYRKEDINITDEEVDFVFWLCRRKMKFGKVEKPKEYLQLLYVDEIKNMLFRQVINTTTFLK